MAPAPPRQPDRSVDTPSSLGQELEGAAAHHTELASINPSLATKTRNPAPRSRRPDRAAASIAPSRTAPTTDLSAGDTPRGALAHSDRAAENEEPAYPCAAEEPSAGRWPAPGSEVRCATHTQARRQARTRAANRFALVVLPKLAGDSFLPKRWIDRCPLRLPGATDATTPCMREAGDPYGYSQFRDGRYWARTSDLLLVRPSARFGGWRESRTQPQ